MLAPMVYYDYKIKEEIHMENIIKEYLTDEEIVELLGISDFQTEEELSEAIEEVRLRVFDDLEEFRDFFEDFTLTEEDEFGYVNEAGYWEGSLQKLGTGTLVLFFD